MRMEERVLSKTLLEMFFGKSVIFRRVFMEKVLSICFSER